VGDVRIWRFKPTKKPKFWRLHFLSRPNRITVGINGNRNRLPLGTLFYSYNRRQLITTMSTRERLQRDRATPEINCRDDVRRFHVTRKAAARSLPAYIAVSPQKHCNPSSYRQHAGGAKRRYLSYSEADFEAFRPAGATRCTDRGAIWHGGGDRTSVSFSMPNFTPIGVTIRV